MAKAAGLKRQFGSTHLARPMVTTAPDAASSSCPNDPRFVDKLRDVVGFYVDPPVHPIVLPVDEKN